MTKFYDTNEYPILLNNIVCDYLTEIGARVYISRSKFSIYNPINKKTVSLGSFIFKKVRHVHKRRIDTDMCRDIQHNFHYNFTIENMKHGSEFHDDIIAHGKHVKINTRLGQDPIKSKFAALSIRTKVIISELGYDIMEASKTLNLNSSDLLEYVQCYIDVKTLSAQRDQIKQLESEIAFRHEQINIINAKQSKHKGTTKCL